jgi:tetratricopeptide (TPR) repeat protein
MNGTCRACRAYKSHRVRFMSEKNLVKIICSVALPIILLASSATAQRARPPATSGAALAEAGRCLEAVPRLKKELPFIRNADLKRSAGLAGVSCAMATGRLDDAVDFIRALTRDFPRDAEVLYQAVHVYSDLSLKSSQDLLINASGSYQVRLLNAEALETQERWNEAAAEYRAVMTQNPDLPGIHYRLGRLLLSLPENALTPSVRDDARREFEEELKINPRNAGAEYVLGEMARQAGDWGPAAGHFANAARLNPAFADAHIGLGRSLISDRKHEEAIRPLEAAVKLQPENPAAHYHLAIAYSRAGRKEQAERESAVFKQTSERARQMKQDVQTGVLGPQKAEP